MNTRICKTCKVEKDLNEYPYNNFSCRECVELRLYLYETQGFSMPEYLKSDTIKSNIYDAKQILATMGYDIDKNIHEQFKVRIYETYGVKFSG